MDNNVIQFVGASCGQHGPYTFYKAFKYKKNGADRIVTLGEFFFVKLWIDSDLLCIGELQLLWIDKNSEQALASLRLYFLPENTPEGRMDHGEDEVLAIAEKVVLRVEDLVTWITVDAEWTWGRLGRCSRQVKEPPDGEADDVGPVSLSESSLDFTDVEQEKLILESEDNKGPAVVILSYPKYCRYRAMMRRLEGVEDVFLKFSIVKALGGFSFDSENTRVMFCRDTFEYPDLEGHELLCNHLAPKLKGRPRGKRKKRSTSPGSESNESECSVVTSFNAKIKDGGNVKNGFCLDTSAPRRSTRSSDNSDTKEFLKKLNSFMKMKRTPLGRTPCLGSKEIDLHDFYSRVQKMGGYDSVTSNRMWKNISDDMNSGQQNSGAATVVKRHYERFLLPYERHVKGEEYKPLPVSERRRLKSKSANNSPQPDNQRERNSSTSSDKSSSPKSINSDSSKETNGSVKQETKISSLRSVRVKPERQKDKFAKVVKMEDITSDKESLEVIKVERRESPVIKTEEQNGENTPIIIDSFFSEEESVTVKTEDPENKENGTKDLLIVPSEEKEEKVSNLDDLKQETNETQILKTPSIDELRKEKLDMLKEGGLEVTPVCTGTNNNEINLFTPSRKSVQLSPSPINRIPINIPQSLNISKVTLQGATKGGNKTFSFPEKTDSTTPPKVVQSRSIYSYSEKTVYGNPKDCLVNSFPVHVPKTNFTKPTGGDLLDLTVASPQKPIYSSSSSYRFNSPKTVVKAANLPIFEGRKLGSNLEITLVESKDKVHSRDGESSRLKKSDYTMYKVPNKPETHKFKENGDHAKPSTSNNRGKRSREENEFGHAASTNKRSGSSKTVAEAASNPKYFQQGVQFPHYLSQLYEGNKGATPYFPMIDPLLYSAALQSLYPQTSSPLLQFTSQEQLKLYSELMAQQTRVPFPFKLPTDEEFSNNNKK